MWIKILMGAVGTGVVLGALGTSKVNKLTNKVVNKVRPKKNRVAIVEVELEDDQDISDLAFLIVKGVPIGTSKDVITETYAAKPKHRKDSDEDAEHAFD